jgi:hypothetical protein
VHAVAVQSCVTKLLLPWNLSCCLDAVLALKVLENKLHHSVVMQTSCVGWPGRYVARCSIHVEAVTLMTE